MSTETPDIASGTGPAEPAVEEGECPATFGPPGTVQAWCTLAAGHDGDHEAYSTDESRGPGKTWPQEGLPVTGERQ